MSSTSRASERDARLRTSVVVLSYNRKAMVRRTLESLQRQTLGGVQVIVVDNASRDQTPDMIRRCFPNVELLSLSENIGIDGRNIGIRAARGEVVVSLDDDIELRSPDTLARVVACFDDATIGAVTLKISDDPDTLEASPDHWWHPVPQQRFEHLEFDTDHVNEAAVAFRKEAFDRVGGYYGALSWGGEEWDLTLGLIDAGYRIRYLPEAVVHLAPRGSLNHKADPRHALLVRNRCWIAFRRLPLARALAFVVPRLLLWAVRAFRYGYLHHYLEGIVGLVRALPEIVRGRQPVSRATLRRLRALRTQVPSL